MSKDEIAAVRRAHYAALANPGEPADFDTGVTRAPPQGDGVKTPDQTQPPLAPHSLPTAEPRAQQLAVVIPADWQDLSWPALKRLAASVCDTPITSRKEAILAVEAELARRVAAAAQQPTPPAA